MNIFVNTVYDKILLIPYYYYNGKFEQLPIANSKIAINTGSRGGRVGVRAPGVNHRSARITVYVKYESNDKI